MGWIHETWNKWLQIKDSDEKAGEQQGKSNRDKQIIGYLVVLGIAGVALMIFADGTSQAPPPADEVNAITVEAPKQEFEDELEQELTVTLGQMAGVGDVKVFITWEGGIEKRLASKTTSDTQRTEETAKDGSLRTIVSERTDSEPIIVRRNDNEEVLVLSEHIPAVRGVLVVADGALDSRIKEMIMRAVQTGLNVPAHKISVVPKRK